MTYFELKKFLVDKLFSICPNEAEREATLILEQSGGLTRSEIVAKYKEPAGEAVEARTKQLLGMRLKRIPLAYVLGKTGFMGCLFQCRPGVLIPRPDTETVCEKALEFVGKDSLVADVCSGSGCIGLSIAKIRNARVDLFDISKEAVELSRMNARELGVEKQVRIFQRNLFDGGVFEGCGKYDVIVSNPPYIRTEVIDKLSPEVKNEPKWALDGGSDGMLFYRRLLKVCPPMINAGGHLVLEIGYDQKDAIEDLCQSRGYLCRVYKDYGNNDRVCVVDF